MEVPDKPADPKEVELTEENDTPPEKKKTSRAANRRRRDNILDPRGLGRRVGDAVLVGDCWPVCLYYLLVYQEISSMASARVCGYLWCLRCCTRC